MAAHPTGCSFLPGTGCPQEDRAGSGRSRSGHGVDGTDRMTGQAYLMWAGGLGLAVLILAATGWWRRAFALFGIRRGQMTIERLGLAVSEPADVERVNSVLESFSGGFNAMIAGPRFSDWEGYAEGRPVLYRPFAHEGAAMGYPLRRGLGYRPAAFENELVRRRPGYRYLYYVGLGFWSGMRGHGPQRLARVVARLDPMLGPLCYDGYGFKHGFFDYLKDPDDRRRLDALEGYGRNVAYQGLGRSFYFLFCNRPEQLIEHLERLGEHAVDGAAGVGLASVFVNPDRLEVALELAERMEAPWRPHVHLGMCFGLKARYISHVEQFERDVARLAPSVQQSVYEAVRECDRVELQIRAEGRDEGYRRWREQVTAWMAGNVAYPLAGVEPSVTETRRRASASR